MKIDALKQFRAKLSGDQPVLGMFVTLESPSITEMAVGLGLDWVVVDAEHGHLDWGDITAHLRATIRSHTVALVRVASLDSGLIKRALDCGADGVMVPWIETAEQLRAAVAATRYPPEGVRGIGAERATGWGEHLARHAAQANQHVLVVPILETVAATRNLPDLCQVPGVDVCFVGPADYSASAGHRGQWEGPGVAQALKDILDAQRAQGRPCGVMTTGADDFAARRAQGFRMLGLGSDAALLLRGLHGALAAAGRDQPLEAC